MGSGRSWRLSEEQNLDLRTIAGGGLTFDAFRSDRLHLRLIGGIVWNNERYQAGATAIPLENGPEVLTGLYLSWFQFRQWNVDSALSSSQALQFQGVFAWTGPQTSNSGSFAGRAFGGT